MLQIINSMIQPAKAFNIIKYNFAPEKQLTFIK